MCLLNVDNIVIYCFNLFNGEVRIYVIDGYLVELCGFEG